MAQTDRLTNSPGLSSTPSAADFDPDYIAWRDQQLAQYDRDYAAWRATQARRHDDQYLAWRAGAAPHPEGRQEPLPYFKKE